MKKRLLRLNSLLKEVISEVIENEVRNPAVAEFVSPTKVEISPDLHQAIVFVSVIGSEKAKKDTVNALNEAGGFISTRASKKVSIRFFPKLEFRLDNTVEDQLRIDAILTELHNKDQKSND